jgi:hypothetical protein
MAVGLFLLLPAGPLLVAQVFTLQGSVHDAETQAPVFGASVYVVLPDGHHTGILTDTTGRFVIPNLAQRTGTVIVAETSYEPDTLPWNGQELRIQLRPITTQGVDIQGTGRTAGIDAIATIRTERITSAELSHAACCNLSEAFETSAQVDVAYTDAVAGTKEIQMLGLAGTYTQIQFGNWPGIRGLERIMGLNAVPGPFVRQIAVAKGIGSATQGYESITGQLQVDLWSPSQGDRLLVNAYGNSLGRHELNIVARSPIRGKWHSNLLLHGSQLLSNVDHNRDGFQDMPQYRLLNVTHQWEHRREHTETVIGVIVVGEDRMGGQTAYNHTLSREAQPTVWGLGLDTRHLEVFTKSGHLLNANKEWQSLAVFANATVHTTRGFFGNRDYTGLETDFSAKVLYPTILGNTNHFLSVGPSFSLHDVVERLADPLASTVRLARQELIPGVYGEYTGKLGTRLTVVAAGRMDWHNLFGWMPTPRLHAKYNLTEHTHLRMGGGRGWHVPNMLAENLGVMTSNRYLFHGDHSAHQELTTMQVLPEIAWNGGGGLTHSYKLGKMEGYLSADFYRTDFVRQMVTDLDFYPQIAQFSYQRGAFSNSAQVEVVNNPVPWITLKAAYRYTDSRARFNDSLQQRPLTPQHRAFFTLTLDRPRWMLNTTLNWFGPQRLPSTFWNFEQQYKRPNEVPGYVRLIGQLTYRLGKQRQWEVYVGGENLTNFIIPDAIIAPNDPFGPFFDTNLVWGPTTGAIGYAGFRWRPFKGTRHDELPAAEHTEH